MARRNYYVTTQSTFKSTKVTLLIGRILLYFCTFAVLFLGPPLLGVENAEGVAGFCCVIGLYLIAKAKIARWWRNY